MQAESSKHNIFFIPITKPLGVIIVQRDIEAGAKS